MTDNEINPLTGLAWPHTFECRCSRCRRPSAVTEVGRDPELRKAALDAVCAWAAWVTVDTGEGTALETETYDDWLNAIQELREALAR